MADRPLVIGVGNPLRHDDGVGPAVGRAVGLASPAARVIEMEGEGAALLEAWTGADLVVIVDAVRSGAAPGTVYRFEPPQDPLPATLSSTSTHAFGLPVAVELGRTLGQLPQRLIVYGIEGVDFTAGEGLSPGVEAAVGTVAARVQADLGKRP
jgi:hydrogenase maturation protease